MTTSAQTVSVPVAVLQRLRDGYRGETMPSGVAHVKREAVLEVLDYIPTPPKVGDVLTAEQIADLPNASVIRDEDGDVLVKVGNRVRRVTNSASFDSTTLGGLEAATIAEVASYYTITLVSLPADCD